ncbi:unnamed protein product [Chrysodeixis includens]|uniref:Uncharacterized protein n=1 Tax=Chrysodeixis includens TaxID=689277 RepID=A0A9P0BMT7_CHRIL|nr:unnamed protein product [Chrysodeixis includens]
MAACSTTSSARSSTARTLAVGTRPRRTASWRRVRRRRSPSATNWISGRHAASAACSPPSPPGTCRSSPTSKTTSSYDYHIVAKNDGRITFAHFARILNYIGVIVTPEDFNLLVRKFIKDSYTLDYVEFLKAVDAVKREGIQGLGPEYLNPSAVIDTTLPKLVRPELDAGLSTAPLGASEVFHPALAQPRPPRHLIDLMLRVQEFVMQRRIRVSEFLRDYDPLNSGRIAPQQFRRAMDAMGLGSVLSQQELLCVMRHYLDPNDKERVCWRTFEDDCDQVFTIKELEKHPDVRDGAAREAVLALPPLGAAADRGEGEAPRELDAAQAALLRVRAACTERAIDLRPAFCEHDEHNNGHVSRAQVRRVLARLGVLPSPAQVRALEARYLDDCGFSYVRLLDEMEERPAESASIASASSAPRPARPAHEDPLQTDIVQILAKIKGKMVREGVRPREFLKQFDPRNELVIPRADFYRGLASARLSLTPIEMDTLMEVFCAPGRRRYVEYERFCNTVGEALTQAGLERAPLLQPVPHVPTLDSPLNFLNFEERNIVSGALKKLSKYPDQLSNILEVFEDMDKVRCGTIPRVSVERALCQRDLLALVSARERDLLYKCFGYRRGCGDEVNYRALCNALTMLYATASAQPC